MGLCPEGSIPLDAVGVEDAIVMTPWVYWQTSGSLEFLLDVKDTLLELKVRDREALSLSTQTSLTRTALQLTTEAIEFLASPCCVCNIAGCLGSCTL